MLQLICNKRIDNLISFRTQTCPPFDIYRISQIRFACSSMGNRKDDVCLRAYGQKSICPYAAISAMLDYKGRAFVLIRVLYRANIVSRKQFFRLQNSCFQLREYSCFCFCLFHGGFKLLKISPLPLRYVSGD